MNFKPHWSMLLILLLCADLTAGELKPRPGFAIAATAMKDFSLLPGTRIAWHAGGREVHRNERLTDAGIPQMIDEALRDRLLALGLRFVEKESEADLLLAYAAGTETSLSDQELLTRFGVLPGYPAASEGTTGLERGSLVIYLIDPERTQVVWRCATQTLIDYDVDPQVRHQNIREGISGMLETLPLTPSQ